MTYPAAWTASTVPARFAATRTAWCQVKAGWRSSGWIVVTRSRVLDRGTSGMVKPAQRPSSSSRISRGQARLWWPRLPVGSSGGAAIIASSFSRRTSVRYSGR